MNTERNKVHLTNFNIAGFSYWDGPEAWENLHIGTKLQLVREADNAFDPYAVAIYFDGLKLDPTAHTERQVDVIVYVKKNDR